VFPTRDGAPIADLAITDFEVFEDRAPQKIEQFEHVLIRPGGAGEGRPEPNTVAQSLQAIKDPRTRVFVLFLDPSHVDQGTSRQISQTLVNALNRLIGPDDYVGLMVPPMKLRDVTFARRTVAMERLLQNDWWGKRDAMLPRDEVEDQYAFCYQVNNPEIAQEMILRYREQQTFDALEDLVVAIRNLREERKAVLAITNGWLIYGHNANLTRPLTDKEGRPTVSPPGNPPIGIDPRRESSARPVRTTLATRPIASARSIARRSRTSTMNHGCGRSWTKPIVRTRRSIPSIRGGWSYSTRESCRRAPFRHH